MIEILPRKLVEKVWGRDALPAPFLAPEGKRIGEIWFEPSPGMDELLAKYLFTSEKLSVQVHPSNEDAPVGKSGKDECWLILDAEPGASLAIGFERAMTDDEVRAAALDGSIEDALAWHEVEAGDFFYLPAGTVHAIGPGLSLIEIQQNSDVTYRLYDYDRPRKLHLDDGIAAMRNQPYDPALRRRVPDSGGARLVDGPRFRLDLLDGCVPGHAVDRYRGKVMVMPVDETLKAGDDCIPAGACALLDRLDELDEVAGRFLVAQPV